MPDPPDDHLQEARFFGWSYASGRILWMIICKRPDPLDDHSQEAGLTEWSFIRGWILWMIICNPKAKMKIFREKLQVSPHWTCNFIVQHKMTKTETPLNWNIVQHSFQAQNILFASRRSFGYYINLFIYQNSRRRICFPTFYPSIFPCG